MASKSIVGLDIEPGYVAAALGSDARISVERAVYAALPGGAVRDGEVVDVDTVASVLRDLFAEHKLPKRVRLGVANQRIVMRTIDLPPLRDPKEVASAIRFQAQDHIPMPLEQAVLEHQQLGLTETPDGTRMRVVLVAARRDMVERLLDTATRAGLRPQGIDLSAFAMIRALHRPGTERTIGYVSVGGITNLAIATGTTCVFTRAITHGTESIAGDLAERRGLTLEHARQWLRHVGARGADRRDRRRRGDRPGRAVRAERRGPANRRGGPQHVRLPPDAGGLYRRRAARPDRAGRGDRRLCRASSATRSDCRSRSGALPKRPPERPKPSGMRSRRG